MGVGRIFSREALRDFFRGGGKSSEICFSHSKLRKQPFFAKTFKIQEGSHAHVSDVYTNNRFITAEILAKTRLGVFLLFDSKVLRDALYAYLCALSR